MKFANDNHIILPPQTQVQRLEAMQDLHAGHGETLLRGLYAGKLDTARQQIDAACMAHKREFATLDAIYCSKDADEKRAYLMDQFDSHGLSDAFEELSEYRACTGRFFSALAGEYIHGSTPAQDAIIDQRRGELSDLLWELGGVGNHVAEQLIRREEGSIRQAMVAVLPDFNSLAR